MSVDARSSSPQPGLADAPRSYLERLGARVERVRSSLCLGIDPDPEALPTGFSRDLHGVEAFARLLIEAASPYAAAVKANLAFFEAFGSEGVAALERIRAGIPSSIPFIADAKRGDINTTASRQATALFDVLGADAVTVSPYLGREAIEPLLSRPDRLAYVLCRTSNPGAGEFQNLSINDEPLYQHVARTVAGWAATGANVGLVVGATAPAELASVRLVAPALAVLVPGVGAQGGDIDAVLRDGPATASPGASQRGGGLLVNVSRGISSAAMGAADPGAAVAAGAERWAHRLRC